MIMGGVRNVVETYTSSGALFAHITPNSHMTSYLTDEAKLAGVYITEKVGRKNGWQFICLEEEWTRGYLQEIQDFMECVSIGRQPRAARKVIDDADPDRCALSADEFVPETHCRDDRGGIPQQRSCAMLLLSWMTSLWMLFVRRR
jgi:hypothetical protein